MSTGIGKIYDTGASLGFAEFFASIVDWSRTGKGTQGDYDRMNQSLLQAMESQKGIRIAIVQYTGTPQPPALRTVERTVTRPYSLVQGWRKQFYDAVNASSSYGDYFGLGTTLAVAEGHASIAGWAPASVQYCKWALDAALASATRLTGSGNVALDLKPLQQLQAELARGEFKTANGRIKALREEYARIIYATAKAGQSTMSKPNLVLPDYKQ